ncbi:MAG: RNHCP domain-containing protein [Alicyclobacillus sp.]|nr:RNHCP domain-containing protein [Alicyclobacillus sp.]
MARKFTDVNEPFTCVHCGTHVMPSKRSCRNHCPTCLYSVHLDVNPGDRLADCGGLMAPVRVEYNPRKGYQIVHRCQVCGHEQRNIAALDDPVQPDSMEAVLELMRQGGGTP